ncbi:MAG: nucleotide exchange factor GrpE [Rothia sp. (in: high G+C Gram-positive bacteria)]|uniref:nucleotide exchange factor GrpE n=1 Tax=Rothia sp. (in: high G+C Gram-positive bacteria) TaxID=1885016 RepID=UPI0026E01FC9|nr:nucleotide exchange factor GrpE [Rothia sp. (in: high G+C Gram-positive bacteria)]MDO5751032.1 nucleotide exchange factor GrpE [Rothia sp. (in: high G+C Gram-positive bacteria)]
MSDTPQESQQTPAAVSAEYSEEISTRSITVSAFVTPGFEEKVLSELNDLCTRFSHKIAEDRAKNQLIVSLQQSLKERDEQARGEAYRGMFREVLVALDRLMDQEPSEQLNASVREEILDIFALRGLERIETTGAFDASVHEIAAVVPATDANPAGSIVHEEKEGFMLGERVLRPARVVVANDIPAPDLSTIPAPVPPVKIPVVETISSEENTEVAEEEQNEDTAVLEVPEQN